MPIILRILILLKKNHSTLYSLYEYYELSKLKGFSSNFCNFFFFFAKFCRKFLYILGGRSFGQANIYTFKKRQYMPLDPGGFCSVSVVS